MRWLRSVPVILGAAVAAIAGAALMLPWPAGGAAATTAALLMTHPSVGRVADGPVRVLLRAIPPLAATAIMLRMWELDRWGFTNPLQAALDLDRYRTAYAAQLLAAGCLVLAIGCAGAAIGRSLHLSRTASPGVPPASPGVPPVAPGVPPAAPAASGAPGAPAVRTVAPAAVLAVTGGLFLLAGVWVAVRIAVAGGDMLRTRISAAGLIEGGAFVQPGLMYSSASVVSYSVALDAESAVLTGATLLGAVLAVLAGARLAAPERARSPLRR